MTEPVHRPSLCNRVPTLPLVDGVTLQHTSLPRSVSISIVCCSSSSPLFVLCYDEGQQRGEGGREADEGGSEGAE